MKEFIDKLIERLEDFKWNIHEDNSLTELGRKVGYEQAIEIVNELAEEYKDGWILCSERLPEEYGEYLCCDRWGNYIIGYPMPRVSSDDYYVETELEIMCDCIAWQPLPQPYKEGE